MILLSFVFLCDKFLIFLDQIQVHLAASECLLDLLTMYQDIQSVHPPEIGFKDELLHLSEVEKNEEAKFLLRKCVDILESLKKDGKTLMEHWYLEAGHFIKWYLMTLVGTYWDFVEKFSYLLIFSLDWTTRGCRRPKKMVIEIYFEYSKSNSQNELIHISTISNSHFLNMEIIMNFCIVIFDIALWLVTY